MSVVAFPGRTVPPANVEVEQLFLGALLINNNVHQETLGILSPECFTVEAHQYIYEMATQSLARGEQATSATLGVFMDEENARYCRDLEIGALTVVNARDYALTIRRLANARELQSWCTTAAHEIEDASRLDDLAEEGRLMLDEIRDDGTTRRKASKMGDEAGAVIDRVVEIHEMRKRGERLPYFETGIKAVDEAIGGVRPGELVILAGAPSMGKSALAGALAHNIAAAGSSVFVQSLEMSKEQLLHRELSRLSGVPVWRLRDGKLEDEDPVELRAAEEHLQRLNLHVDDNATVTIGSLHLDAQQWRRKYGLDLLVVDYLQLMSSEIRTSNRVEEVSRISRGLKILAREFEIPVIAVSQLSRAVEARDGHRPILADLRESGSIEQDADIVMFVFREAYYHARLRPSDERSSEFYSWQADQREMDREAEVIIAKQRQGAAGGSVRITFDPQTISFTG